jgi:hypothetical protein
MKLRSMALLAAMLFSTCALGDEQQFTNGQTIKLDPGRAYILVRVIGKEDCGFANIVCLRATPLFFRVLSSAELDQANALAQQDPDHWRDHVASNVFEPTPDSPYLEDGDEEVFLTSVEPGTYLLGGIALAGSGNGVMVTSFCMGTVKFEAKPGVITDLGTIVHARDDQPTTIPELAQFVTGLRVGDGAFPTDAAIRPATSTAEVPETLKSLPLVAADYRAAPPLPNYTGAPLGRLAPLPGVLAYDKDGQVMDLKSGQGSGN